MTNYDIALTTIDNPYSPFSQWDEWYLFDLENGYDCCGYLARMQNINTTLLKEEVEDEIINEAINDIVNLDPSGMYIKVKKVDPKTSEHGKDFKAVSTTDENTVNEQ